MTRWGRRRSGGLALGLAFLSLGPSGAPALAKATAQVVPWTSRPASGPQTPGPTPNTIPKGTPVCRAGQLTGGLTGTQGMTGAQLQSVVVIVNRSSTECRLSGPPTLAVFEADGAEIGTNPGAAPNQDTTAVLMVPNRSVSPIHTATPGGEAGLGLVWSPQEPDGANCLSTAPIVARMTFNFPGSTGNVVVTKISVSPLFAPCGGVKMVAFSATVAATPAPIFKLVAKLTDPSRAVPGHLLKYRLQLRNVGKKAINLRNFCPDFVEGLSGVEYKASSDHALNCGAAGKIGGGGERIFAMQYPVPRNAPRQLLDLEWYPLPLPWQVSLAPPPSLPLHIS
ncbi:MAG TPA: DUF4232 domain-containing protein [Candidatus Dormibacteraeota bacterium]|nr:DUF4232 domain-containing protein [Candidatus Dormibacteraeota bacterium]